MHRYPIMKKTWIIVKKKELRSRIKSAFRKTEIKKIIKYKKDLHTNTSRDNDYKNNRKNKRERQTRSR